MKTSYSCRAIRRIQIARAPQAIGNKKDELTIGFKKMAFVENTKFKEGSMFCEIWNNYSKL